MIAVDARNLGFNSNNIMDMGRNRQNITVIEINLLEFTSISYRINNVENVKVIFEIHEDREDSIMSM